MARAPVPDALRQGPFTVSEAAAEGVSFEQLQSRAWRRMGCGYYTWVGLPDSPQLRLEVVRRRLPQAAVFSGLTALWLHGVDVDPLSPVDVTVPASLEFSTRVRLRLRRAQIDAREVVPVSGFRATTAARAVADLAKSRSLVEATVLADAALHLGVTSLEELASYPRLTRVCQLAEPAAESPMETRLRLLLVLARLPRPIAQADLHDDSGAFLARADLYYPTHRLVIEYDGGTHRESLAADDRRQNQLLSAGYRLLRFTGGDLARRDWTAALVRKELASPPSKPDLAPNRDTSAA